MAISRDDVQLLSEAFRRLVADLEQDARERQAALQPPAADLPAPPNPAEQAEKLRSLYDAYFQHHTFKPGDVVRWKSGLQNRRFPDTNGIAIVIEVLNPAAQSPIADPGSPYFREILDIRAGVLSDRGDLTFYLLDSKRLEPAQQVDG